MYSKELRVVFVLDIYNVLWLLTYFSYAILFLLLPAREIVRHQLGAASASIVLLEQVGEDT